MSKAVIAWALLFIFILMTLALSHQKASPLKIKNPDFPGLPVIIFVLDARNTQSVKFISDIFDYLFRNGLLLNVGIVYLKQKTLPFNGTYRIYKKEIIRRYGADEDSFYFFSTEGNLLLKGSLSLIPDHLLKFINPQYALDNRSVLDHIRRTAVNLEDVPFIPKKNIYRPQGFSCYLFYDQICFCNNSMTTIQKITKIEKQSSAIHHYIVPFLGYSQEEIELIISNNSLLIDFILPNSNDINEWNLLNKDRLHRHPLNELIILANKQGRILVCSNNWDDYMAWRREYLNEIND